MKTKYLTSKLTKTGAIFTAFFALLMMTSFFAQAQDPSKAYVVLDMDCHGKVEVYDVGSDAVVETIVGPTDGPSVFEFTANKNFQLRTLITSQFSGYEVTKWMASGNASVFAVPTTPGWSAPSLIEVTPVPFHTLNLTTGAIGSMVYIEIYFDVIQPLSSVYVDADIKTVSKTPVILPVEVTHDLPLGVAYNNPLGPPQIPLGFVKSDLRFVFTDVFPAGAEIIKVEKVAGIGSGPLAIDGGVFSLGGVDFFDLYLDVLVSNPPHLIDQNGNNKYELTIAGVDNPTVVTFVVNTVAYSDPDPRNPFCETVFDAFGTYTLTWNDLVAKTAIDDVDVCAPECIVFEYFVEYPVIENLDDEILNDVKFSIFTDDTKATPWDLNGGAEISVLMNDVSYGSYTLPADASEFYLSDLNNGILELLNISDAATVTWTFEICGANPGNYYVLVENFAWLDDISYVFAEDEFLIRNVGARTVTASVTPEQIQTVTDAPAIFDVVVAYGDLDAQNIDPEVLIDALITFDPLLPEDAYIVELLYNGTVVPMANNAIGAVTNVLLSDIIGVPAPTALDGHSNRTDTWTITVAGVNVAGVYEATIQSIAYLDYDVCFSVMSEAVIEIEFNDMDADAYGAYAVCEGDDITGVYFCANFPEITNNPDEITVDALISLSYDFPAGVSITWSYQNGTASGTFITPSPGLEIRLSELLAGSVWNGGVITNTLQYQDDSEICFEIGFGGLPTGQFIITVVTVAVLDGVDYVLIDGGMTETLFVYPYPEPVIEGLDIVFSGYVGTYSVEEFTHMLGDPLLNEFSWIFTPETLVSFSPYPEIEIINNLDPVSEAKIATVCGGVVSFTYELDNPGGHQMFLFTQSDNDPNTIVLEWYGDDPSATGTIEKSFDWKFKFFGFTAGCNGFEFEPAVVTISDFQFDIDTQIEWLIDNILPDGYNNNQNSGGKIPVIVPPPSGENLYEVVVDVEWPFTGSFDLVVTQRTGGYEQDGDCPGCPTTRTKTITVLPNRLIGQVKYYNPDESPMPSPFMVNYNGMDVPDYFYVALITSDTYTTDGFDPDPESGDPVELVKAEEIYIEHAPGSGTTPHSVLEAGFEFNYNLNPYEDYRVVVWDGSLYAELPSQGFQGFLGQAWTWHNWPNAFVGGVNATDALLAQHMVVGSLNNGGPQLPYRSNPPFYNQPTIFDIGVADANSSFVETNPITSSGITSLDALLIQRRGIGLLQKFPNNTPNFAVAGHVKQGGFWIADTETNTWNGPLYDDAPFTIFGTELPMYAFNYGRVLDQPYIWETFAFEHHYFSQPLDFKEVFKYDNIAMNIYGNNVMNIYYNAIGDINSSFYPVYGGFKADPEMELLVEGELAVKVGDVVEIPVSMDRTAELGAITLGLYFDSNMIEVLGTSFGEDNSVISNEEGVIQMVWHDEYGIVFGENQAIATITVRVLGEMTAGTSLFDLNIFSELADPAAKVLHTNLRVPGLSTSAESYASSFSVNNYPNPFTDETNITYTLPENGHVQLVVFDKLGKEVSTLVDHNQPAGVHNIVFTQNLNPGVYYYRITFRGENGDHSQTKSMIVVR